MEKLKKIRNNFLKLRGGKLISVESIVLAFIIAFVMIVVKDNSPYLAFVVAVIVAFIFPILVGVVKTLAWFAAILFSLIWGILGFIIAYAIAESSVLIGGISGIVIFLISFKIHKNYSGLTFQGVTRKNKDKISLENSYIEKESVKFCPNCGRRITSLNGICDVCNK